MSLNRVFMSCHLSTREEKYHEFGGKDGSATFSSDRLSVWCDRVRFCTVK